jgi:hypothetical protein
MVLNKILGNFLEKIFKARRDFLNSTNNPKYEQRKILLEIIRNNEDSVFGKNFGFSKINSIDDFLKQVPITGYDFIKKYIDKEKKGESGQLTSKKVKMFALTSGTVSDVKYIPVTEDYINSYRAGTWIWISSLLVDHPRFFPKTLTVASPKREKETSAGIPCGSVSGLFHEEQSRIVKALYVSQYPMFEIPDPESKYYTLTKAAVENNVSHINTANPITILKICNMIKNNSEKIIKDIYDGTISTKIPNDLRSKIKTKPNKRRAKRLEKLLDKDMFKPEFIWPDLGLIGCWKGGTQYLFLERFPEHFGDVIIRDIGLLASEGRMTIPISDNTSSGILDIKNSFFEFIPEFEIQSKNPEVLRAEQLEKGENYFILLTTQSGLYRYNIKDLVKVTGFYNNTPELAFLNKGSQISSIVGEKISENQVINSYKKVKPNSNQEFFLFPELINEVPNYVFCSVFDIEDRFLDAFDKELRKRNIEYDSRRNSGRLGPISSKIISKQEFEDISGRNTGKAQFKFKYLRKELNLVK